MKRFNVRSRIGRKISIFVALTMIITTISSLGAGMIGFAFTDTTGHWAESMIDTWSERGVINGYEDGTFMPDANITRAEFTKVVASAGGFTTYSELSFNDVAGDEWFAQYLRGCVAAGVVSGYDDGTFRPDAYITREEAVVMIDRAYDIGVTGSLPFTDADSISDWAVSAVASCVGAGIINGYEDGSFMPAAYVTRAEVVKMIDSADGYTPGSENNGNSNATSSGSGGLSWAGSGGGSWGGGSTGGGSSTSTTARVTFNANGGVFADDSETATVTVRTGLIIGASAPEDPTREGYVFDGWYRTEEAADSLDATYKWNIDSNTVSSATTLYAGWYTSGDITVTFETNGGSAVEAQTIAPNSYATEPAAPTRAYYTFGGWYADSEFRTAFNFSSALKQSTTVYAKWTVNPEMADAEITIPDETSGTYRNGTIIANPKSLLPGETTILTIIAPDGYDLNGNPTIKYTSVTTGEEVTIADSQIEEISSTRFSFTMPQDVQNGTIVVEQRYKEGVPTPRPTAPPPTATPDPYGEYDMYWVFSSEDFTNVLVQDGSDMIWPAGVEVNGLNVSKDCDVDSNNKTFNDSEGDSFKYTKRAKIGTATLTFNVTGACKIKLDAATASNDTRTLTILAGNEEIGTVEYAADVTDSFNCYYTKDEATTITIRPNAGCNVYGLYVTYVDPSSMPTPEVTPEPTLDPNIEYNITVNNNIANGSVVVTSGDVSSDSFVSQTWRAEDDIPADATISTSDTEVGTIIYAPDSATYIQEGNDVYGLIQFNNVNYYWYNFTDDTGSYDYVRGVESGEIETLGGTSYSITTYQSGVIKAKMYIYRDKPFYVVENGEDGVNTTILNFRSVDEGIYDVEFKCEADKTYTLLADGSKAGIVSVEYSNALTAKAGETVKIETVPNQGYKATEVIVEPEVSLTQTGENTYEFEMPTSDVSVSASFVDESAQEYTVTAPKPENGSVVLEKVATTAELSEDAQLSSALIDSSESFLMADDPNNGWIVSQDGTVGTTVVEDTSNVQGNDTAKIMMTDKAVQYVLDEAVTEGTFTLSYDFLMNGNSSGRSFRTYLDNTEHPYDSSTGQATAMGTDGAFFHMDDVGGNVYVTDTVADIATKEAKGTQVGSSALENDKWYRVVINGDLDTGEVSVAYYLHGTDGMYAPDNVSTTAAISGDVSFTEGRNAAIKQVKFMRTANGTLYYDNITLTASTDAVLTAYNGESVKVVATPDSGYILDSISATRNDNGESIAVGGDGIFVMPDSDVTVNVTFAELDIPEGAIAESTLWSFDQSDQDLAALGSMDGGTLKVGAGIYKGLTITPPADGTLDIDGSKKSFDGMDFSYRIKLGGNGSETSRCLSFTPALGGTVSVYFAHASSKGENRTLIISQGGVENTTVVEPGGSATATVTVTPGQTVYIYGQGGLNVYGVNYVI